MKKMTPRERVRTALKHQEPDRVPLLLGGCSSTSITLKAYQKLKKYMDIEAEDHKFLAFFMQLVEVDERILKAFDIDNRTVAEKPPSNASFL